MARSNPRYSTSPQDSLESGSPPSLPPSPLAGIRRLRETLLFKNTRSALAEKEILKSLNRHARPLTHRNVDVFLIEQDQYEARQLVQGTHDDHVTKWLQQIP
jgi:hypothetical protein